MVLGRIVPDPRSLPETSYWQWFPGALRDCPGRSDRARGKPGKESGEIGGPGDIIKKCEAGERQRSSKPCEF